MTLSRRLAAILTGESAVLVRIEQADGSTPREAGAVLLVGETGVAGTIGGGQLEFHAIDMAREMLASREVAREIVLHLGPHLGQCCGGRVRLKLWRAGGADVAELAALEALAAQKRPHVAIFGAGHTGLALCRQLALLPFNVDLIDDRAGVFDSVPGQISCLRREFPALWVDEAPLKCAFIVLTHSHALDYAVTAAALRRGDAAYVGMIGSATKKTRFASWFLASGGREEQLSRLTCPIGGGDVADKRPEIIAALTVAEVIRVFSRI